MGKVLGFIVPGVLLSLLVATVLWSGTDTMRDPHEALADQGKCGMCHNAEDGEVVPDGFQGPIIDQCYSCHPQGKLGRSHPVNVDLKRNRRFPDMEVPEVLMVGWDWSDVLSCATCHGEHGEWKSTVKSSPGEKPLNPGGDPLYYRTYYLRIPGDPEQGWAPLCDSCHKLL